MDTWSFEITWLELTTHADGYSDFMVALRVLRDAKASVENIQVKAWDDYGERRYLTVKQRDNGYFYVEETQ